MAARRPIVSKGGRRQQLPAGDTLPADAMPYEKATQEDAEAGTATEVMWWSAERLRKLVSAWWLVASSGFGRALALASDAAAGRSQLGLGESDAVVVRSMGVGGAQNVAGVWSGLTVRNDTPGAPGPSVEIANNQPVLTGLIGAVAATDMANSDGFNRGGEVRFLRDGGASMSRGSAVQIMTRAADATGAPSRRFFVSAAGNISAFRRTGTAADSWFGNGVGVLALGDAESMPSVAPDLGAIIFSSAGKLWVRGAADAAPIVIGQTVLEPFTLATLPSAVANPRREVYVSNLPGQPGPVVSDGVNWLRVPLTAL